MSRKLIIVLLVVIITLGAAGGGLMLLQRAGWKIPGIPTTAELAKDGEGTGEGGFCPHTLTVEACPFCTPALIESIGTYKRYRLLVQKQIGTIADTVNVQISLPQGAEVVSITPAPVTTFNLDNLILDINLDLTTDQWVEVIYQEQHK